MQTQNTPTATELKVGLKIVVAVAETVREMGAEGAPASIVFVALQTKGVTYEGYRKIVGILKGAGLVRETNDSLYWIGPAIAPAVDPRDAQVRQRYDAGAEAVDLVLEMGMPYQEVSASLRRTAGPATRAFRG